MSAENKAEYGHVSVMVGEVMENLQPRPGDIAVDGTTGLGGHARVVASTLGPMGRMVCFDRDAEALRAASANLAGLECRLDYVNRPFEAISDELARLGIKGVDRILLDLGVSSLQLDKAERGFSFMRDGPLDMRMDQAHGDNASTLVNRLSVEELSDIFSKFGEERFSLRIAKRIVEKRGEKPITTTGELSLIVSSAVPGRGRTHPATRVFQALRMAVNDELGTLSRGLAGAGRMLNPGGRLAVLTFHSLEDRLVKRVFIRWKELGVAKLVNAKAISCSRDEARTNRRARSAKLRVVERL